MEHNSKSNSNCKTQITIASKSSKVYSISGKVTALKDSSLNKKKEIIQSR